MPQVRTHDKRIRDLSAGNRDEAGGPGWWQEADGTLVVRAGIMNTTPLCWRVIGGSVHLAAQPADLALLDPRPPLDHTVLHAVLRREFPGGDSWFTGVSRVEAGTQVRFSPSSDSVSRERWWRIGAEPPEATPVPDLWGALVAQCERIQQTANRVAVMLSGGIDSSAIAAAAVEAARRAARPPPLLISARYPGLACDETSYQDAVAARLGAPLMAINAAAVPLWPALQNACARYHAPLVDGQDGINLALLEAAWREGCDVALIGVGGDELFEGRGLEIDLVRSGRFLSAIRLIQSALVARPRPWWRTMLRRAIRLPLSPERAGPTREEAREAGSWCRAVLRRTLSDPGLGWRLEMADRTFRQAGIRLEAPFLASGVLSAMAGCPSTALPGDGVLKAALRRAVAPYLPAEVVGRVAKANFDVYYEARVQQDGAAMCRQYRLLRPRNGQPYLPRDIEPLLRRPLTADAFLTAWLGLAILLVTDAWHPSA